MPLVLKQSLRGQGQELSSHLKTQLSWSLLPNSRLGVAGSLPSLATTVSPQRCLQDISEKDSKGNKRVEKDPLTAVTFVDPKGTGIGNLLPLQQSSFQENASGKASWTHAKLC